MIRTRIAAALTIGLLVVSAHQLTADVKTEEKGLVKFEGMLGRVVNLFGGKAAKEGIKEALARMRSESVKMDGTPILTTLTVESVKSADQVAAEQKDAETSQSNSSPKVGGVLGGLAKRAARKNEKNDEGPKARATFMTSTNEVLKVTPAVSDADIAVPAGFKENK